MPGWIKGTYHCITAGTGVGKTKFAKYAVVLHSYRYCKANNIPLVILWFAREESQNKFWTSIMSELLYQKHGITITYYQIIKFHEGLTPEIEQMINDLQPELNDIKKYVIVNDHVSNPTGILYEVKKVLQGLGTFTYEAIGVDDNGNIINEETFKYNDPDTHVIVVPDHIGLLGLEPKNKIEPILTTHSSMGKFSKYAIDIMCKRWNCIVFAIQQQGMQSDNLDHRKAGLLIPAENKLGGNLEIGRDYQYIWGLFKPSKYDLDAWLGYNVKKFGDCLMTLHLIKHRDGSPDHITPLYFEGITGRFTELPIPFIEGTKISNPELSQYYV